MATLALGSLASASSALGVFAQVETQSKKDELLRQRGFSSRCDRRQALL